ncbi:MAG TPA: FMN-binding negative transcriptional regulator [Acidimicrobiales bacterium]
MHRVPAFDVDDPAGLLADLVGVAPAVLVSRAGDALESTILPMLYDPRGDAPHGVLAGHVARTNPLVRDGHGGEAIVVVNGPEGYITPSWYASKRDHGKVVPTWDYVTVQANGPLVLHDDPAWLLGNVTALTARHERGRPDPWAVTDAPPDFVDRTLRGIVGVEVPVTRLAAKAKLSQNRPAADVDGVIAGLRAQGTPAAAALAAAVAGARPPDAPPDG